MNKTLGLVVLLLGVALMIATFVDAFSMAEQVKTGAGDISVKAWPMPRVAMVCVGALLGVLGAYGVSRKPKAAA